MRLSLRAPKNRGPGVDERDDEVLHGLERPEDLEAAAQHSRRWFAGLELLDEG